MTKNQKIINRIKIAEEIQCQILDRLFQELSFNEETRKKLKLTIDTLDKLKAGFNCNYCLKNKIQVDNTLTSIRKKKEELSK